MDSHEKMILSIFLKPSKGLAVTPASWVGGKLIDYRVLVPVSISCLPRGA